MTTDKTEHAEDPRFRNTLFDVSDPASYVHSYTEALTKGLRAVDGKELERATEALLDTLHSDKRVYSIGNGGSAAIADHLACDLTKGTHVHGRSALCTHSLNANVPIYTAIANDFGFERVFSKQIQYFGRHGDVLIAISSSGNSENIVKAVQAAKETGMKTIGLSGFSGGKLKEVAEISLYVPMDNYGVVEDCHQALMHIIAQCIAGQRDLGAL